MAKDGTYGTGTTKERPVIHLTQLLNCNETTSTIQMYSDGSVINMMEEGSYAWCVGIKNKTFEKTVTLEQHVRQITNKTAANLKYTMNPKAKAWYPTVSNRAAESRKSAVRKLINTKLKKEEHNIREQAKQNYDAQSKRSGLKMTALRAVGKEQLQTTECTRIHSYRAEALGLLSGLLFLNSINWKGKVEWYTDSLSVINTWDKLQPRRAHLKKWYKERDADVWKELIKQKGKFKKQVNIRWVKAHADKLKRPNTIDEKANQIVDNMADDAYKTGKIKTVIEMQNSTEIWVNGDRLNGSITALLTEQLLVTEAKNSARHKPELWGTQSKEVAWKTMLQTSKQTTIQDMRMSCSDMWDTKWTTSRLHDINMTESKHCMLCNNETETQAHLVCDCRCSKGARMKVIKDITEEIRKAGGKPWAQDMVQRVYGMDKETITKQATLGSESRYIRTDTQEDWKTAYDMGSDEGIRSNQQIAKGMAHETVITTGYVLPMWNGVITKAYLKWLQYGGVPETKIRRLITSIRHILTTHRNSVWRCRSEVVNGAENEQKALIWKQNKNKWSCPNDQKTKQEIQSMSPAERDRWIQKNSKKQTRISDLWTAKTKKGNTFRTAVHKMVDDAEQHQTTTLHAQRQITTFFTVDTAFRAQSPRKVPKCTTKKKIWKDRIIEQFYARKGDDKPTPIKTKVIIQGKEQQEKTNKRKKTVRPNEDKGPTPIRDKHCTVDTIKYVKEWQKLRNKHCDICNHNQRPQHDITALDTECKGCSKAAHSQCVKTNDDGQWWCKNCDKNKTIHPCELEWARLKILQVAETANEENVANHSDPCAMCNKQGGDDITGPLMSCASCNISAHEHTCAKSNEVVVGFYWQCTKCRKTKKKLDETYINIMNNQFRKVHQIQPWKMNSRKAWKLPPHKRGNPDITDEEYTTDMPNNDQTEDSEEEDSSGTTQQPPTRNGKQAQARCSTLTSTKANGKINRKGKGPAKTKGEQGYESSDVDEYDGTENNNASRFHQNNPLRQQADRQEKTVTIISKENPPRRITRRRKITPRTTTPESNMHNATYTEVEQDEEYDTSVTSEEDEDFEPDDEQIKTDLTKEETQHLEQTKWAEWSGRQRERIRQDRTNQYKPREYGRSKQGTSKVPQEMEENGILAMLYAKVPPECQEKLLKFIRTPKTIRSNPLLLKLYRSASNESKKKWKSMRTIPMLMELYRKAGNETDKTWKNAQNKYTHNKWTKEQNPILNWTLGNSDRTTRKPRTPKQASHKKSLPKQTPLNQATHKHTTNKKNAPRKNKANTPNAIVNAILINCGFMDPKSPRMRKAANKTLQIIQKKANTPNAIVNAILVNCGFIDPKSQRMRKAAKKTSRIIQLKQKNKGQHNTSRTQTQNTTNTTNTNKKIRKHTDNEAGSTVQHGKIITSERHNKRRKKNHNTK